MPSPPAPLDPIVLRAPDLERIRRHALERRPEECCGVLLGRRGAGETRVEEVRPADNAWDGDRRRRYEIAPAALLEAMRSARRRGLEIVGYYHSHPAGDAVPSRFDLDRAWPGVSYLIFALGESGARRARSWRFDAGGRRAREEPVVVEGRG